MLPFRVAEITPGAVSGTLVSSTFRHTEQPMTDAKKTPTVRAQGGVHEKVLDEFRQMPPGLVLDVPTGEGALSQQLLGLGYRVIAGDIAQDYLLDEGMFLQMNMDDALPFAENSFDYVACVEGIEHIENPYALLREFARVLKPEGTLVLSTPNVLNIRSRIRFFFSSHHKLFKDIYPGWHLTPPSFRELKYAFGKAQFTLESIKANRFRRKWRLIYPFIRMLVVWNTHRKHPLGREITTPEFLEGPVLIYRLKLAKDKRSRR